MWTTLLEVLLSSMTLAAKAAALSRVTKLAALQTETACQPCNNCQYLLDGLTAEAQSMPQTIWVKVYPCTTWQSL